MLQIFICLVEVPCHKSTAKCFKRLRTFCMCVPHVFSRAYLQRHPTVWLFQALHPPPCAVVSGFTHPPPPPLYGCFRFYAAPPVWLFQVLPPPPLCGCFRFYITPLCGCFRFYTPTPHPPCGCFRFYTPHPPCVAVLGFTPTPLCGCYRFYTHPPVWLLQVLHPLPPCVAVSSFTPHPHCVAVQVLHSTPLCGCFRFYTAPPLPVWLFQVLHRPPPPRPTPVWLFQDVCDSLGVASSEDAVQLCVCREHLSDPVTYWHVTPHVLAQLSQWWTSRMTSSKNTWLDDRSYLDIVAR